MKYPVSIEKNGDGYLVTFPDIPEALTEAVTYNEAKEMALDALITAFDFYFEDKRPIPMPSQVDSDCVNIPPSVSAKIFLLNELLKSGITYAELARRIEAKPQSIHRLIDLHHATKIDAIDQALRAIGRELQVSVI